MVITTDGKLVSKLEVPSPTAPNLAFGPDGKTLYAVDDTETPYQGTGANSDHPCAGPWSSQAKESVLGQLWFLGCSC